MKALNTSVPLTNCAKRNCWTLPTGELGARLGLAVVKATTAGATVYNAFSVFNQRTGVPWHYLVQKKTGENVKIAVYDENFSLFQTFNTLGASEDPVVTWAVVEGVLAIGSPSFATLTSDVGGVLSFATKTGSTIPGRVTLDVPRGLVVSWAGRLVVASGLGLYISDALQPFTFDPTNVLDPPGAQIFGLHVAAGGALVLATPEGVWGLPEDAASSADVYGVFSLLTSTPVNAYDTTCSVHGLLYALTESGFRQIDGASTPEVPCNEPFTAAGDATWAPVHVPDFRQAKIRAGSKGPIVSIAGKTLFVDLSKAVQSWWTFSDAVATAAGAALQVKGVLHDTDGSDLYALTAGVWAYGGSEDYAAGNPANDAAVFSRAPTSAMESNVVRWMDFATDADIGMYMAIPGASFTFAGLPQTGLVLGTGSWGDTYASSVIRSRRGNFAKRLDELDVLVRVSGPGARFGLSIDLTAKGPGRNRRTG